MKKWISLLLAALLLTGCGGEQTLRTEPAATEPAPVETEILLDQVQNSAQYAGISLSVCTGWTADAPETRVLRQAAETFSTATGATVEILTEAEGRADIFAVRPENLTDGNVLDLTAMAEASGFSEKSYPALRTVATAGEKLLAVPVVPVLSGILYSPEAFARCGIAEIPRDWPDFLDACQRLKAGGFEGLALDETSSLHFLELHLVRQLGEQKIQALLQNHGWKQDPDAVQAIADLYEFLEEGFMAGGRVTERTGHPYKILSGNTGMILGSTADCRTLEGHLELEMPWGIFPYPGREQGGDEADRLDAELLAISPECQAPQAAFDFLMLLCTGSFDRLRAQLTKTPGADPRNADVFPGTDLVLSGDPRYLEGSALYEGPFGPSMEYLAQELFAGNYTKQEDFLRALEALGKKQ